MVITNKWIKIALFNLLLVSLWGLLMRYKIVFPLRIVEQKHLLHAHSHFAFTGWISHAIYISIVYSLSKRIEVRKLEKYFIVIIGNLLSAYGMLIAFSLQGYAVFSIIFSTLSLLIFYLFTIFLLNDLKRIKDYFPAGKWYKAAVFLGVLSTAGTFYLVKMMVTKSTEQNQYLASIYFYLHFQYNGWFLFAAFGLIVEWLQSRIRSYREDPFVFRLFFFSSFPCYFLSTLWAKLPVWLYVIVVVAAIAQTIGWILFLKHIVSVKNRFTEKIATFVRNILLLSLVAYSVKMLLQLASVIPAVSRLAFGFRSIVIAYLHLILLGAFTLFFIGYFLGNKFIILNKLFFTATASFIAGIILNELVLMLQGAAGIFFIALPGANEALFYIALLLFISLVLLFISQCLKKNKYHSAI